MWMARLREREVERGQREIEWIGETLENEKPTLLIDEWIECGFRDLVIELPISIRLSNEPTKQPASAPPFHQRCVVHCVGEQRTDFVVECDVDVHVLSLHNVAHVELEYFVQRRRQRLNWSLILTYLTIIITTTTTYSIAADVSVRMTKSYSPSRVGERLFSLTGKIVSQQFLFSFPNLLDNWVPGNEAGHSQPFDNFVAVFFIQTPSFWFGLDFAFCTLLRIKKLND